MIEQMTQAIFAPLVGSGFVVRAGEHAVTLTLVLAEPLRPIPNLAPGVAVRADPFQLQFQEPTWSLPQGLYDFEHPKLGSLSIFVAPIGPNADKTGFLYQAIFN